MKKILALVLSILMLFSLAAFAEGAEDTALVSGISNIVIESGSNTISLDGFEAYFSIDTADGLALVAQAFNSDESLALAIVKLVGSQLNIGIDGMDKTYVYDIAQLAGQDTSALGESVRALLPVLMDLQLPPITVASLPKLDATPIVSMLGGQTADGTTTFSVSHEIIDTLLDQILEAAKSSTSSVPGAGDVLAQIEQLRSAGLSLSLEGTVVDSGEAQTISVEIHPVSGDQIADTAAILNFTTAQDAISLTVDLPGEDGVNTIADLELQTNANENVFTGTLDIAGVRLQLSAFQENGLQKVALTLDSGYGDYYDFTLTYGESDAKDLIDLTFTVGDAVAFEMTTATAEAAEGGIAGTFELTANLSDAPLHITADIEEFLGTIDLGGFELPAATAPIEELESDESTEALQTALMPLLEYFSPYLANTAA